MDTANERSERRAAWAIHVRKLGNQDRASMSGSVEARLRAVDQLSADGWRLAAKPMPGYRRREAPIRILSMRDASAAIPFIGRRHLVENKRAAGRTKDLADLEELGERPPG